MDQLRLLELKDPNTLLDGAVVTRIGVGVTNADVPMSVEDVRSSRGSPCRQPFGYRVPVVRRADLRTATSGGLTDAGQRRAPHRMFRATPTTYGRHLVDALFELDRPALVLWGSDDRFIPLEQAGRQRDHFPES